MDESPLPRDIPNPWQTVSSRVAYQNDWITVREDQVIRPDGKPGIYGVVDAAIATAVVALDADDCVTLIGQYRYTLDVYSWELVEGGTRPGEAPLAAAQRELREEAGLVAADWTQLGGTIHLSNCYTSEVAYTYLARGLQTVPDDPDDTEDLLVRRVPLDLCFEWLDAGEFTDAMTLIGLARARQLLR